MAKAAVEGLTRALAAELGVSSVKSAPVPAEASAEPVAAEATPAPAAETTES